MPIKWPSEDRIDIISTNGNDGEHYEEIERLKSMGHKEAMKALVCQPFDKYLFEASYTLKSGEFRRIKFYHDNPNVTKKEALRFFRAAYGRTGGDSGVNTSAKLKNLDGKIKVNRVLI